LIAPPVLTKTLISALDKCKVIACSSIGMDKVDGVELANEKGIVICNVPDVFVDEVANHTMALLLACIRWIVPVAQYVKEGGWGQRGRGRGRPQGSIHRITGETLGLIGFGNIARAVAKRAAGFDLKVMAYDPYVSRDVFERHGVRQATLGQVLQDADFVSIHVPLLPQTRHLIGAPQLALMKQDAILINTARGPVVDEAAPDRGAEERPDYGRRAGRDGEGAGRPRQPAAANAERGDDATHGQRQRLGRGRAAPPAGLRDCRRAHRPPPAGRLERSGPGARQPQVGIRSASATAAGAGKPRASLAHIRYGRRPDPAEHLR
ncbi:MAG: NAD(P)-dependent oxidoreductase, partial [Chloroflexota bacterium]